MRRAAADKSRPRHLLKQFPAPVTATPVDCLVVIGPKPVIGWNVHDQDAFRAKHPVKFAQRCRIIIKVIEHVRRDNRVKNTVLEWKRGDRALSQVGGYTASFPRELEGQRRKIHAGPFPAYPARSESPDQPAGAAARIKDGSLYIQSA